MESEERVEVGVCENCGKPIYDGEEYGIWEDNIKTHRECPTRMIDRLIAAAQKVNHCFRFVDGESDTVSKESADALIELRSATLSHPREVMSEKDETCTGCRRLDPSIFHATGAACWVGHRTEKDEGTNTYSRIDGKHCKTREPLTVNGRER